MDRTTVFLIAVSAIAVSELAKIMFANFTNTILFLAGSGIAYTLYIGLKDEDSDLDWTPLVPPRPFVLAAVLFNRALSRVQALVNPPGKHTLNLITGFATTKAIYELTLLGIPDLIKAEGGLAKLDDLAKATGTDTEKLGRLLRACAFHDIFYEASPGIWRNTRGSGCLRKDHPNSLRDLALHMGSQLYDAMARLGPSLLLQDTTDSAGNLTAFQLAHDGLGFWEWLEEPGREHKRAELARAMLFTNVFMMKGLLTDYDWRRKWEGKTICDVGGGLGHVVAEVMRHSPTTKGVLYDLPTVIELAKDTWPTRYADLLGRIEFFCGDFTKSTAPAADAYLLRNILHDWNDAGSTRILGLLRRSARRDTRLIVVDLSMDYIGDAIMPTVDLLMLSALDGKERTTTQLETLFRASGWKLHNVTRMRSMHSVVEAVIDEKHIME